VQLVYISISVFLCFFHAVLAPGAKFRAPRELQTSHYNEEAKSSKEVCKKD